MHWSPRTDASSRFFVGFVGSHARCRKRQFGTVARWRTPREVGDFRFAGETRLNARRQTDHQRYTVYFGFYQTEFDFAQVGLLLLYLSLALALVSAGEYFKLFVDAVEAKEERLQAAS